MRKLTEARREAILDTAEQEFSAHGYDGASIAVIAARIGSSKPTIYRYFASKEELFAEVTSRTVDRMMQAAEIELMADDDLIHRLALYGQRYLAFRQSPAAISLTRLSFGESGRSDIGRLLWSKTRLHGVEKVGLVLADAMTKGVLRPADPSVAAFHLFALFDAELSDAVVLRVREPASMDEIKAVAERAVEAFIGGYRPSSSADGAAP